MPVRRLPVRPDLERLRRIFPLPLPLPRPPHRVRGHRGNPAPLHCDELTFHEPRQRLLHRAFGQSAPFGEIPER